MLRTNYQGQSHRPQGQYRAKQTITRSPRSQNLRRLLNEMDVDLIAVAFGIRESVVGLLAEGREEWDAYLPYINARLTTAGIPSNWLERNEAPMRPEYLTSLRNLAAGSEQKAPIRRNNFNTLMRGFDERLELLADALEVIPSSMHAVSEGKLAFDDQRFGHLNPRLLAAGFPDGWLDVPNAELTPELIQGLASLATDAYELEFEQDAQAERARLALKSAKAAELLEINANQAATESLASDPLTETTNSKEITMTEAQQFEAQPTNTTTHGAPVPPPVFGGVPAGISRAVLAAGRAVKGPDITTKPSRALPAAVQAEATEAIEQVVAKPEPRVHTLPKVAPATSVAVAPTEVKRGRGRVKRDDSVTLEQSLGRATALASLLDNSRRGAKVCLWRDLMGKTLPYWANVKKGGINFNDTLATAVIKALELPDNWLDAPQFPPKSLAPWVMDASVPLPAGESEAVVTAKPQAATMAKPFAKPPAAAPVVTYNKPVQIAATPKIEPVALPAEATKQIVAAVEAPKPMPAAVASIAVQQPEPLKVAAPVTAPAPAPVAMAPKTVAGNVFEWAPPSQPVRMSEVGYQVQTLKYVLDGLARDGAFTAEDASRLLSVLMANR